MRFETFWAIGMAKVLLVSPFSENMPYTLSWVLRRFWGEVTIISMDYIGVKVNKSKKKKRTVMWIFHFHQKPSPSTFLVYTLLCLPEILWKKMKMTFRHSLRFHFFISNRKREKKSAPINRWRGYQIKSRLGKGAFQFQINKIYPDCQKPSFLKIIPTNQIMWCSSSKVSRSREDICQNHRLGAAW